MNIACENLEPDSQVHFCGAAHGQLHFCVPTESGVRHFWCRRDQFNPETRRVWLNKDMGFTLALSNEELQKVRQSVV